MANHPNRGWRSRWTVDLATCTATHQDGWTFSFEADPDDPGALDGALVSQPDPLPPDALSSVSRIAQEAGQIYSEALSKRS